MNRYEDGRNNSERASFNKKKSFVVKEINLFEYATAKDAYYTAGKRRHKFNLKEYNLKYCVNYEVQGIELMGSKVNNYGHHHFLEKTNDYDVFEFPSYSNKNCKRSTGKFLVVMHNLTMNYWFITYEIVTCKTVRTKATRGKDIFVNTYYCTYEGPLFGFSHYEYTKDGQVMQYGIQNEVDAKNVGYATHDRFDLGERREHAYFK